MTYEHGDRVWYKREKDDKQRGQANVVFQVGKVVRVRHGSAAIRVSVNRLIKQGMELAGERESREEVHDQKASRSTTSD